MDCRSEAVKAEEKWRMRSPRRQSVARISQQLTIEASAQLERSEGAEQLRAWDQKEIKGLQRELCHKDKALAEAAALLMAANKIQAPCHRAQVYVQAQ